MSEIKLLPCPFCGEEAKLSKSGSYAVVSCLNSSCNGNACCYKYDSPQEAIEHWNTRKPMERIIERLAEASFKDSSEVYNFWILDRDDAIEIVKEEGGIE